MCVHICSLFHRNDDVGFRDICQKIFVMRLKNFYTSSKTYQGKVLSNGTNYKLLFNEKGNDE